MDGDSTLNTDDYAFTLTGLDSFHGADIDVTVTGDEADATTITTLDGNDIITTGSGADTITSGAGADIIDAGAGNDTVTLGTGAGDDIVTLGTGDDSLVATAVVGTTQKVLVTDFEDAGATVGDTVTIEADLTTLAGTGTPTIESETVTVLTADGAYNLAGALTLATNAVDIVILSGGNETTANLADDFEDENGDELFKYVADATSTTASITADGDHDFYIIAYDGGEAFLYAVNPNGDGQIDADELFPLIHFDSQVGTFVAEDFVLA